MILVSRVDVNVDAKDGELETADVREGGFDSSSGCGYAMLIVARTRKRERRMEVVSFILQDPCVP
jgi:hypothetical protein